MSVLRSMTGFGRGTAAAGAWRVEVEVGSVNRKQLDVHVGLPREWSVLEPRIQEKISQVFSRGRVNVEIRVHRAATHRMRAVHIDEPLAAAHLAALRRTGRRLGLADDLSLRDLAGWPGIVTYDRNEMEIEPAWALMARALDAALTGLERMRRTEGRALVRDIRPRVKKLRLLVRAIRRKVPGMVARYRAALRKRIGTAQLHTPISEDKVLREVVLYADKADITEELTRLDSHLDQIDVLMRTPEPVGRALDFLMQELLREINTVGSKAADAAVAQNVVNFKADLERVREQVQNIE